MKEEKRELGDLLGDMLDKPLVENLPAPPPEPITPRDNDAFIVALAKAWGEDPYEVLKEFHKENSPLSRLVRKLLGVNFREPLSVPERDFFLSIRIGRATGLRGVKLARAAAAHVNSQDPPRNITEDSMRESIRRGAKALAERDIGDLPLAAIFLQLGGASLLHDSEK